MSKITTMTSAMLALLLAASGNAMAAGAAGGAGGTGGGGGQANGGGAETAPADNDMGASGTKAHKPMAHKSSSTMHKSTQKPMTDDTKGGGGQ